MDWDLVNSIWIGFTIGITIVGGATIVLLPASYAMNKFIYHGWFMRFVLGLLAIVLSLMIIPTIVLFGARLWGIIPTTHYFGLLPLRSTAEVVPEPGFLYIFAAAWNTLMHPFQMKENSAAYEGVIESMLAAADDLNVVPEALFQGARDAAAIPLPKPDMTTGIIPVSPAWSSAMTELKAMVTKST